MVSITVMDTWYDNKATLFSKDWQEKSTRSSAEHDRVVADLQDVRPYMLVRVLLME